MTLKGQLPTIVFALTIVSIANAASLSVHQQARALLDTSDVSGGLVVQIGCGDGHLALALKAGEGYLVQALDTDVQKVQRARNTIQSLGKYGPVSVDRFDGKHLPYIDNMVNLIVVQELGQLPLTEIKRVLCPQGVALIAEEKIRPRPGDSTTVKIGTQTWQKWVKPRPTAIDDWTHYLYDASNNAVSHDQQVGPLGCLQWIGSPRYARHHDRMSSVSAVVSAQGRVFYIMDEADRFSILTPPKWTLTARDAFNGVTLWKRDIDRWHTHLWPLKSGPAQLPRRLVAVGDRVYVTLGIDGPLLALDAATGQTLKTYTHSVGTEEVIYHNGILYILTHTKSPTPEYANQQKIKHAYRGAFWDEAPRKLLAIQALDGEILWQKEQRVLPVTLAANSQHVVFHDGESVVCLDSANGREQWHSQPVKRSKIISGFYAPILLLYEDVVLFSGGEAAGTQTGSWESRGKDTMTALSLKDGELLWQADHPPSGYRSPEDLLVANGLVWTGNTRSGRDVSTFTGRDPRTGEIKQEFPPTIKDLYWFHHRCYRGKATDNYLLMSRTGTEFIDIQKETWEPHHWTRGACLYGLMPANGLVYNPPHPCACYLEAKLSGFNALAPADRRTEIRRRRTEDRLEHGPAFGQIRNPQSTIQNRNDWPTYRGNNARNGCTPISVPAQLNSAWRTHLGGKLTSPVIADGKLFVATINKHTLHALHAKSGQTLWQFTAGGRIDSPPTIYGEGVFFGSADGWVYCLNAKDGQMAWRFRVGPMDQRLMSFEQIESVWPVHGSVLIQNEVLYCVGGRSMFLDGGLTFCRLNPATGRLLSETVLDNQEKQSKKDLHEFVSWLNMPTAMPDILSSDGRLVYMRSQPFQLDGTRLPLKAMPSAADADRGAPAPAQDPQYAHLFSPTGFLDDSGWHRTYWLHGSRFVSGWCGYFLAGQAAPAGRILVHDKNTVYGFGRKPQYYKWTSAIEHHLFAADQTYWTSEQAPPKEKRFTVQHQWTQDVTLLARAMVLAGDTLFAAGPPDLIDEPQTLKQINNPKIKPRLKDQAAALAGEKGAILLAVSKTDGQVQSRFNLDSPPVFDGMVAANGNLYLSTLKGDVRCYAGQ